MSADSTGVFIIHGRDEARWRELKELLANKFRLTPIVLGEQPSRGKTLIEKFEHYGRGCAFAVAIFTPDDEVVHEKESYLQARPNTVFEVGWFCAALGRERVVLLLKEGTKVFSDFDGIVQLRFRERVAEVNGELGRELRAAGLLEEGR